MSEKLDVIKDNNEFNYVVKKIDTWYKSQEQSLNIITIPYNSTMIFKNIILNIIRQKGKILYIWNGTGEKRKLLNSITKENKHITYSYIKSGTDSSDIVFINNKSIEKVNGDFQLVIYDDISFYSALEKEALKEKCNSILKNCKKFLIYSIEDMDMGKNLYLGPLISENPFIEPRIINTRINLNRDIPYILYDYLKWFREKKKNILLLVPKEENIECVYEYYTNKLKMRNVKVIKADKNNSKIVKNDVLKIKDKSIFIITNDLEVMLKDFNVDNAVVLFSDDDVFSYKKLIYICGYVGKVNKDMSEVLLVSKDISKNMDIAKNISRNFNKFIWERKSKEF